MPNAVEMLKHDHEKVKALFQQYEAAGHRAHRKKQGLAEEVFAELAVHTTLEEELFYPAMKRQTDQDGTDLVAEAVEEHHVVTTLMDELKGLDPMDERYDAKFKVLMENVEHHIEEEEGRCSRRPRRYSASGSSGSANRCTNAKSSSRLPCLPTSARRGAKDWRRRVPSLPVRGAGGMRTPLTARLSG